MTIAHARCLHKPGTAPHVSLPTSGSQTPSYLMFPNQETGPEGHGLVVVTHWVMESGLGTLAPLPMFPATKLGCFYATNYNQGTLGKGTCDSSRVRVRPRALPPAASLAEAPVI